MRGERWSLGLILAAIFGVLAIRADQPIVENYVGRQIPTAMVSRNLARGSGFLHPTLDTAPFPNRFLVEPPIFARLVAWVRSIGFVWGTSGRITSATLTTLGVWGFYGLVRRREGPGLALVALASFGIFPVVIRYGRAFQPDAAMLGFVLLGMHFWDEFQAEGDRRWAWLGGAALSVGLAIKVTSSWVLIPYFLVVRRWPAPLRLAVGLVMVLPAFAWYSYAWGELSSVSIASEATQGSLAPADNAAIWLGAISPANWLRFATWEAVGRNLLVRAFTPLGFALGMAGWVLICPRLASDRFWVGWGVGCGLAILGLASKWHHGYYWLVVAPLVALGTARVLVALGSRCIWGRIGAVGLGSLFLALCGVQSASTWRTPAEWGSIRESSARIAAIVPRDSLLIAPEAVLYYTDRAGFRLEFSPEAVRRASGEWGRPIPLDQAGSDPMALVDFYRNRHFPGDPSSRYGPPPGSEARKRPVNFAADVGPVVGDERRIAWREALRRRPSTRILLDEPDLIIANLGSIDDNG